jgi:alpha-L-fucosidase
LPAYLNNYAELWKTSPREANRAWFRDAGFGLFIHYGLYSQLARHEWVLHREAMPLAEYERLFDTFRPDRFDADAITDLALEAGMGYVNLTACHHEGFCLWDSATEPFNSMRSCGRDLVRELAAACDRKGLGFFAYYTHVLNWRHPYALTRDLLDMARPNFAQPEPRYRLTRPEEWRHYWDYAQRCLAELAQLDAPLAGIWLDLIMAYYRLPQLVPIEETYALIRKLRPEAMVSYKQGATGDEDFAAPEFLFKSIGERLRASGDTEGAKLADAAWERNRFKHNEICMTLQANGSWGYFEGAAHRTADEVWRSLAYARAHNCNLLANVGPLPDGSIHPDDVACLREVGRRLRTEGWPAPDASYLPDTRSAAKGA